MDRARVAIVTGGTGALGGVLVTALLSDGWTVHVPFRIRAGADELKKSAGQAAGARLHLVEADVSDPKEVERLFQEVDKRSGRLDALCNVAGGFAMGPIDKNVGDRWRQMIDTNATSAYLCCAGAVPRLKAAGGGRIVSIASAAALDAPPGMAAYVAAKAAVVALTRSLAAELGEHRITVNAIAPTTIDTPANRKAMPKADRSGWVSPDEIATTIRWLLSEEAALVTGNVIRQGR